MQSEVPAPPLEKVLKGHIPSQVSSFVAPTVTLYFPGAQSTQDVAAAEELYYPAVQELQVDSLEAPTEELNFPAAQSEQVGVPVDELNFPTAQTEQEIAPSLLNFPAEQGPSQSELEAPSVGL